MSGHKHEWRIWQWSIVSGAATWGCLCGATKTKANYKAKPVIREVKL